MSEIPLPRESIRICIPLSDNPEVKLVGVLERLEGGPQTGRKLALVSNIKKESFCVYNWHDSNTIPHPDSTWIIGVSDRISKLGHEQNRNVPPRHKDYLFQKRLAKALPIDSFRFDFRSVRSIYLTIYHAHGRSLRIEETMRASGPRYPSPTLRTI